MQYDDFNRSVLNKDEKIRISQILTDVCPKIFESGFFLFFDEIKGLAQNKFESNFLLALNRVLKNSDDPFGKMEGKSLMEFSVSPRLEDSFHPKTKPLIKAWVIHAAFLIPQAMEELCEMERDKRRIAELLLAKNNNIETSAFESAFLKYFYGGFRPKSYCDEKEKKWIEYALFLGYSPYGVEVEEENVNRKFNEKDAERIYKILEDQNTIGKNCFERKFLVFFRNEGKPPTTNLGKAWVEHGLSLGYKPLWMRRDVRGFMPDGTHWKTGSEYGPDGLDQFGCHRGQDIEEYLNGIRSYNNHSGHVDLRSSDWGDVFDDADAESWENF